MNADLCSCRVLAWDTDFFGVRIGTLDGHVLTAGAAAQAVEWCRREQVACLYFLAESSDPATARVARTSRFDLVDVRLELTRPIAAPDRPGRAPGVRAAAPGDTEPLKAIARASHRDSRFYFDGRFPGGRCDDLYATWIERSCRGHADAVLVADHEGHPAGYVTCHLSARSGRIGLCGVAPAARGRGVGTRLLAGAVEWFGARAVTAVEVATQARNVAAQALYQRQGFRTWRVRDWYHYWPPDDGSRA